MTEAAGSDHHDLDVLQVMVRTARWDRVEPQARTAIAHHPDDCYPLWALSVALSRRGRQREAFEAIDAACALQPDDPANLMQLCDVARRRGMFATALRAAYRSVRLAPHDADAHRRVSYVLGSRRDVFDPRSLIDPEGSLAAMARAIELEPGCFDDHRWRADVLDQTGRIKEAEAEFARALELSPANHETVNSLGLLHLPRRPIRAARLFRESARLDPSCPKPRRNLTSAIHAGITAFTVLLVVAGVVGAMLRPWAGIGIGVLILSAVLAAGVVGAITLWHTLPRGARHDVLTRRWKAGLVLVGICACVLAADLGDLAAGSPFVRATGLTLLVVVAVGYLVLPRSRWSRKLSKEYGSWTVPRARRRTSRRGSAVTAVSR